MCILPSEHTSHTKNKNREEFKANLGIAEEHVEHPFVLVLPKYIQSFPY